MNTARGAAPRLALVANPESGTGAAETAERILRSLGAEVRRFALAEAEAAAGSGPERLVVAGGDGSLGGVAAAAGSAGVPLAVVPTGTANDFARALGIPADLEPACRLAVAGRRSRRLDLGWLDGRPFVNAASAGLAPHAARHAGGLKRALGPLAYALGAIRAGLTARPVRCEVRLDGEPGFAGEAWQVTVGVTGAFGGGAELDADPADTLLECVVVAAGSRLRLAAHAYGMRTGRLERQRGTLAFSARTITVTADGGGFNVDGELVDVGRARFALESRAYEVVIP